MTLLNIAEYAEVRKINRGSVLRGLKKNRVPPGCAFFLRTLKGQYIIFCDDVSKLKIGSLRGGSEGRAEIFKTTPRYKAKQARLLAGGTD